MERRTLSSSSRHSIYSKVVRGKRRSTWPTSRSGGRRRASQEERAASTYGELSAAVPWRSTPRPMRKLPRTSWKRSHVGDTGIASIAQPLPTKTSGKVGLTYLLKSEDRSVRIEGVLILRDATESPPQSERALSQKAWFPQAPLYELSSTTLVGAFVLSATSETAK